MSDEKEILNITNCPNCGSEHKLAGDMAQKEKDEGRMAPGVDNSIMILSKVVADDKWLKTMPFGSSVPSFTVLLDICTDCGTVYAYKVITSRSVKSPPPQQNPPQSGDIRRN